VSENTQGSIQEVVLMFLVFTFTVCSTGCSDVSVTRYESVGEARADRLFDRGWVPDVLPDESGPLTEAHNIDTSDTCAKGEFATRDFDSMAVMSSEAFRRNSGQHAPAGAASSVSIPRPRHHRRVVPVSSRKPERRERIRCCGQERNASLLGITLAVTLDGQ
jgi:hypothetical protein